MLLSERLQTSRIGGASSSGRGCLHSRMWQAPKPVRPRPSARFDKPTPRSQRISSTNSLHDFSDVCSPSDFGRSDSTHRKSAADSFRHSVEQYYGEVWNHGTTELLDGLVNRSVVYSDVLGNDEDHFGAKELRGFIEDFQHCHPLLKFTVDDIIVEDKKNVAVAFWHALAADLLPHRDGVAASGQVSDVAGTDKFTFDRQGRISSIASFRDRFAEEEVQLVDWDHI